METLTVQRYNQRQTRVWQELYNKAIKERGYNNLPQLAFYVSEKKRGYICFNEHSSYWGKTKKDAIAFYERCNKR